MTDTGSRVDGSPAEPAATTSGAVRSGSGVPVGEPARVLAGVAEILTELGESTLWAARTPAELVEAVTWAERVRSVLDAVQLGAVAEVEATGAARGLGWASTKDFLTAVTGGVKGSGGRLLRLAKAVTTDRCATGAALATAAISRHQAEAIVTAVDRLPGDPGLRDAAERLLIDEAGTRDASDLAQASRSVLERLDPDGTARREEAALRREERSAHLGRTLSLSQDGWGGVVLRGRGSVEDAAWITAALSPLSAPDPATDRGACGAAPGSGRSCGTADCAHDGRDPREHGTRFWDALVEGCRRLAGNEQSHRLPDSHGLRPRVVVTVDHDALRSGLGTGVLETGQSLSAAAVRRLACDAEILPAVLGSASQVLDVGRASRLVLVAIWVALVVRDRQCAFPGCTRPPVACDAHHIRHWVDGGPTSLDNLVMLCRTHHTTIHTTPWEVRLDPLDRRPEFIPPAHLDPERRPRRRQPLRT